MRMGIPAEETTREKHLNSVNSFQSFPSDCISNDVVLSRPVFQQQPSIATTADDYSELKVQLSEL